MVKYLIARLRPHRDDDIAEGIRGLPLGMLSDMIRDGVRMQLQGRRSHRPIPRIEARIERAPVTEEDARANLDQLLRGL